MSSARTRFLPLACLLVLACLAVACQKKTPPPASRLSGNMAVAAFTQPMTTAELMAGSLPEEPQPPVSLEVLRTLDADLAGMLSTKPEIGLIDSNQTRGCQEIVSAKSAVDGARQSAFKNWLSVADCLTADYLLVPQLISWRERVGGEWGVESPASVVLELFLIDAKTKQLVSRFRFNETQAPLSSNVFGLGTFFERGGRWLSARQLADEGLRKGLKEFGL